MSSYALELAAKPRFGLLMFKAYPELRQWLETHKPEILSLGATINYMNHMIIFESGNKLILGYGEGEDLLKYLGGEFDFVLGTSDKRLLSRVR